MFRKSAIAVAALALMSSAAFAQAPGTAGPPAQLSGGDPSGDSYNDRYDDRGPPPPPDYDNQAPPPAYDDNRGPPPGNAQAQAQDQRRDLFCRRDAAARTGYVTPGEAASHEQTAGTVGGTVTGAALGAIIGGASHAAGAGALIGAGAGLIAGTAIGSDNARHAAADVQRAYGDAYYACMSEADDRGPPDGRDYAYGPPPPPPGPGYYPAYPYPYYYPPYYGPSVVFGFGGYYGYRGHGGFHRGHR